MHVFYTPDIATNVEMPEEEAGHCLRVLRLTTGDEVILTDGWTITANGTESTMSRRHRMKMQGFWHMKEKDNNYEKSILYSGSNSAEH